MTPHPTKPITSKPRRFRHPLAAAVLIALAVLAALTARSLYHSKHGLEVTHYEIAADEAEGEAAGSLRIVHLTDLHNSVFGENNDELVAAVAAEQPDLILMTGDLVNGGEPDTEVATGLIRRLVNLAPCAR